MRSIHSRVFLIINLIVFAPLLIKSQILGSKILATQQQANSFMNLVGLPLNASMINVYRASRDGFTTSAFISAVNGINGTYTIIKSTKGYILPSLLKFGAVHELPYAWVLKYGSIWYRYKNWIENGVDILTDVWKDTDYIYNYDPFYSASTTQYQVNVDGNHEFVKSLELKKPGFLLYRDSIKYEIN